MIVGIKNELVLIDFGLSKNFDIERQDDAIVKNRTNGTPQFLAPELFDYKKEVKGRPTDIWAVGLSLYAIATGYGPFDDAQGLLGVKTEILEKEIDYSVFET